MQTLWLHFNSFVHDSGTGSPEDSANGAGRLLQSRYSC